MSKEYKLNPRTGKFNRVDDDNKGFRKSDYPFYKNWRYIDLADTNPLYVVFNAICHDSQNLYLGGVPGIVKVNLSDYTNVSNKDVGMIVLNVSTDNSLLYMIGMNGADRLFKVLDLSDFTTLTSLNINSILKDGASAYAGTMAIVGREVYIFGNGKIAKIDPIDLNIDATVDIGAIDSDFANQGGHDIFQYGNYLFVISSGSSNGKIARIDLGDFTANGISILDCTETYEWLKNFTSFFVAGKYAYVAGYNGVIGKLDIEKFVIKKYVDIYAVSNTLWNMVTTFTDGRYGYCISDQKSIMRIDLMNFSQDSVEFYDYSTEVNPKGLFYHFNDVTVVNNYAYFAPEQEYQKYPGKQQDSGKVIIYPLNDGKKI